MLKGRLGLETARVPHVERHGLLWLRRGRLYVADGTVRFGAGAGADPAAGDLGEGDYAIPYQRVSCLILQPGSAVTHDALRVLARHGTGLVVAGEGGVRCYASMPAGPDRSALARRHARLWADGPGGRVTIARRMYAWRLGEILPADDIAVLRGIEGARVKAMYKMTAKQFGVAWSGRRYDRERPWAADEPNLALNHAAVAVRAMAEVATAAVGAVPQLGFIHEDSGIAFCLDIADLYRESLTVPAAFEAVARIGRGGRRTLEHEVRRLVAEKARSRKLIPTMIDRIKELLGADDGSGDA